MFAGPGCCGWFYSCISNTTAMFAAMHGFAPSAAPHPLSARTPSSVHCRGYSKGGAAVSTAQVVDCSWPGPHGWPHDGDTWAAELIMEFFLQGKAPPLPPPLPPPACKLCGKYNCDGWIASDPAKYTCAELKRDWNCDCHGCTSCPNVTARPL